MFEEMTERYSKRKALTLVLPETPPENLVLENLVLGEIELTRC